MKTAAIGVIGVAALSACSSGDSTNGSANGGVSTVVVCDGSTELDVSYQGSISKSVLEMSGVTRSRNCTGSKAVAMPAKLTDTAKITLNRAEGKEIRRRCLGPNMLYTLPYSVNGVSGSASTTTSDARCANNAPVKVAAK